MTPEQINETLAKFMGIILCEEECDGVCCFRHPVNRVCTDRPFNPHSDANHLNMVIRKLPWGKQNLMAKRAQNICDAEYAVGRIKRPENWFARPTETLSRLIAGIVKED